MKSYMEPEIEVVRFSSEDLITTSGFDLPEIEINSNRNGSAGQSSNDCQW